MDWSDSNRIRRFYSLSHWLRLLLLVLLAATFLGTTGQAVWQLIQPVESVSGMIIDVTETRVNSRLAIYNLILRSDQGETHTAQLENNGRILRYLLDQEPLAQERALVHYQRGKVTSLSFFNNNGITLRDSRVPPVARLLIGLLPLLLMVFHLRPGLMGRNTGQTDDARHPL
jgi:hypothetical protein